MRVYRITRKAFAKEALSGEGARRDGGRWNPRGAAMVYCAANPSTAMLELLVHVDPDTAPDDLVLIEVEIPDEITIQTFQEAQLPKGWQRTPSPEALADMGKVWLDKGQAAVLIAPSAVLPSERCVLLNPRHSDMAKIRIVAISPLVIDPRLL